MIPKQAIEKAMDAGWNILKTPRSLPMVGGGAGPISNADIALDPTFWKALGKALGWQDHFNWEMRPASTSSWFRQGSWNESEYHAHRFYDLMLTDGDTEKFWAIILQ